MQPPSEDEVNRVLRGHPTTKYPKILTNVVKIYVCSTKSDFEIERKYLWASVLPDLQNYFVQNGLDIQFVDVHHGTELDHNLDRHAFDRHLEQIRHSSQISYGPFFLCLIGNKYGLSPLPAQLEECELQTLKTAASKLGKDPELITTWYKKDDSSVSGHYRLQPISTRHKRYYLRSGAKIEDHYRDVDQWATTYFQLIDVISHAASMSHAQLKQNLKDAFFSGVALEVQEAITASSKDCFCVLRNLQGIRSEDPASTEYLDPKNPESDAMVRLRNLQEELAQELKETNKEYFLVPWKNDGLLPDRHPEHMEYLKNFISSVIYMLKTGIEFAQRGRGLSLKPHVPLGKKLQGYTCANLHAQYFASKKVNLSGFGALVNKIRTLFERGSEGNHYAIMVEGPEGSGKTSVLAEAWFVAMELFGADLYCVVRCVDLATNCRTSDGILRSLCRHINSVLKQELDFEGYSYEELLDSFCSFQVMLSKENAQWVFIIDGVEKLVINDYKLRLDWLGTELKRNIHLIFSYSSHMHKPDYLTKLAKKLHKKECVIQIPDLDSAQSRELVSTCVTDLKPNTGTFSQILKAVSTHPSPLLVKLTCDSKQNTVIPKCANFPESLDQAVIERFERIERHFGMCIVRHIAQYISASFCGLTEMELLDILSCNNTALSECFLDVIPDILRFPNYLWIDLKSAFGMFIEEYHRDGKYLLRWRHHCIQQIAVFRYLNAIEKIRSSHHDIANLFLETWLETCPFVVPDRSIHIVEYGQRWISPQPLLYSETKYNMRRLNELWFQLIAAGEIAAFKEQCFCNFEYLLAKVHATSVQVLLTDLEVMQTKLLDAELYLIAQVIRQSEAILTEDPLQLASELIGQLRKITTCYPNHLDGLVVQCMQWCDSYTLPLLIPLTSWLPSPVLDLIIHMDCATNIVAATTNQSCQHVFCTCGTDVHMYHVASKKMMKTYKANYGKLKTLLVSYDNKVLFTGSADGVVVVWSAATAKELHVFRNHKGAIFCLAVTHDDSILISGSKDKSFNVMSLDTFEVRGSKSEHQGAVTAIVVNGNDTVFATGSVDCKVKLWATDDLTLMNVIDPGLRSPIDNMTLTADNSFLLVGCEDKGISVVAFVTGTYLHKLEVPNAKVTSMAVAHNCYQVALGCSDGKLYIYNFRNRLLQKTYTDASQAIVSVTISGGDSYVMGATKDNVYFWKLYQEMKCDSQDVQNEDEHLDHVTCIAISEDGKTAVSGSKDGTVKVWNLDASDLVDTLDAHNGPVTCVAIAEDDAFIVSGSADKTVKVWSNSLGIVVTNFTEHHHEIKYVDVLKDSLCILSTDKGGVLKLWQADHGHTKMTYSGQTDVIAVSPCGKYSASGQSSLLNIWTVMDGNKVQSITHSEKITCVTFTFDSLHLVTGSVDKSLKIWETDSGKLTQVLVEHEGSVTAVAVTNCNQHVISGSADNRILIWNLSTGAVERHLVGHSGAVTVVRITRDGSILISGSCDGTLRVWGIQQGCLITIFDMHVSVLDLQIVHDASHMIVCLENKSHVPLMCLHNTPATDVQSQSQVNVNFTHGKRNGRHVINRRLSPAVSIQFNNDVLLIDTNRSDDLRVRILNDTPILPIPPKPRTVQRPSMLQTARLSISKERKVSPSTSSSSAVPEIIKTSPPKAPIKKSLESRQKKRKYKDTLKEKMSRAAAKNTDVKKKSKICDIL